MKTNQENQVTVLNQLALVNNSQKLGNQQPGLNALSGITASHAIVTNVEFLNGKSTSIVTLFNCSEFDFEEVNRGIGITLSNHLGLASKQATLYRLNNGKLQETAIFKKQHYNNN
ncbi:hypothetical protein QLS31_15225 [Flavobacterium sp. XS2P24]|uniref:hypothetical protein n=1 Tax=Flavobacterium sp. XS2P24 TaxID=3041249 RepID=UPI0024A8499F|nr:hypothetical protein [Flavobacterium sp. XS2P24]MDI6051179.1 hypothetical protein [Flavobacterium sp. XS2P24]